MEGISMSVILVFIVFLFVMIGFKLYSHIKLKGLRQTAIDLICEAEKAYEKGKNCEKFQMVLEGILKALPAPAKLFLNEKTIEFFIQAIFDSIKIALDTNTNK